MSDALRAFSDVNFNYVRSLDSVWKDAPFEVSDLNRKVLDRIISEFFRHTTNQDDHAIGEVGIGTGGTGKTHLVGRLRQRVWDNGGWFVLLDIVGLKDFWRSAALCFAHALSQKMTKDRTQGQAVLRGVAKKLEIEHQLDAELRQPDLSLDNIRIINEELFKIDRSRAQRHADVLRALYLFCSDDFEASNLAYVWLQGLEAEAEKAKSLGFTSYQKHPVELVEGLSWIMSLSGPTLVAVDQFDSIVSTQPSAGSDFEPTQPVSLASVLGAGLIDLHDVRVRGMTVITCTEVTWQILLKQFTPPQRERFAEPMVLKPLLSNDLTRSLIVSRMQPAYAAANYRPTKSTHPFSETAIASATGMSPRQVLIRCEEHRRLCMDVDRLLDCDSLIRPIDPPEPIKAEIRFDNLLQEAKAVAEITGLLEIANAEAFGQLLGDVLGLFARQATSSGINIECDNQADQQKPLLHGRLTITYLHHNDDQRTICFRAIEHTQWNAFQARLGAASTAAGMDASRTLFIVRRSPMPAGPKMRQLVEAFRKAGGKVIDPSDDDLKVFVALCSIHTRTSGTLEEGQFEAWLRDRRPLCNTGFFHQAGLCPVPEHWNSPEDPEITSVNGETESASDAIHASVEDEQGGTSEDRPPSKPYSARAALNTIPIGRLLTADAAPIFLPTSVLPRHTAIIAGAGSGKTVLLRRLVEEAALAGIPAIVIDPNNDLSRLGDAWPENPSALNAEDAAKAKRYSDSVEVVIWTPGIHAGNPLFLSVLPDFAAVGDDRDERDQAVMMAADTLGPIAGAKSDIQKGVLTGTVRYFANKGGGSLTDMTALLSDLPEGVSAIRRADEIAAKMADGLLAAVETNPLLKASGAVLDPKLLFYGADARRTRISVINLSGLASDAAKQDFVNRLQMTLFGWIKKNPSPTGRLYVIDEAQNFVPSGQSALSKTSGVQLVAQARKYGLGMIVVTQAPKGIDNKVVSNCTTQFLGKQNSPTDQQTVKEMIQGTGGRADDIGKLKQGEFYFKTEGSGKPVKIATPICLTYHPSNPPTPEEVVARAKRSAP